MERPGTTEYSSLLPLCHFVTSATSPLCHFCRLLGWSCLCAASLLVSAAFSLLPLAWLVLLVRGLPSRFCRVLTSATCLVVSLTRGLRLVGPAWAGTAWNHRLFLANQTPPPTTHTHVFFQPRGVIPETATPGGQQHTKNSDGLGTIRFLRPRNHQIPRKSKNPPPVFLPRGVIPEAATRKGQNKNNSDGQERVTATAS